MKSYVEDLEICDIIKEKKDLDLGTKIKIENELKRREVQSVSRNIGRGTMKAWKSYDIEEEGIFLGYRKLNNGIREWYSDHIEYFPKESFFVALVCTSKNKNPFYSTKIQLNVD